MNLFEDFDRVDYDLAAHQEDTFTYLNRSARPLAGKARQVLEKWFSRYPDELKKQLYEYFKSDFNAAFYELFLYSLLNQLGGDVTVHPDMGPTINTHPDFHVRFPDGNEMYMEATVFTGVSESERGHNAILDEVYDAINEKINARSCFLAITEVSNPDRIQPSLNRIVHFIEEKLESINPDAILAGEADRPTWTFQDGTFILEIQPIIKDPEHRGLPGLRPIGMYPIETWRGTFAKALRDSIEKKRPGKYGITERPYVVAINVLDPRIFHINEEVPGALYGPDSVWYSNEEPRHTRISAVLATKVYPWNVPNAQAKLCHNPNPRAPLQGPLCQLPELMHPHDEVVHKEGLNLRDIFNITEEWPSIYD